VDNLAAANSPAASGLPAPPSVLIIDDNKGLASAMAKVLDAAGYRAAVFHNGQDALNYVAGATSNGDSMRPVAALVDIHLPDIHGLVVSAKLREALGPAVPIIIISGDTSMANLNALPHVGATYFFSKPISAQTLLARLRESIGHSR